MPKDSFEQLFEQSDKSPSKNVLVELLSRNSANTAHRPLPGTDVRYWPYSQMNYGGFTVADNKYLVDGKEVLTGGPAPGSMWVNTYPRKNFDLPEVSNIYSHEALHSRASQAGGLPLKSSAELSAIQQGILKRMRLYQDSKAGGPYWGMRPESSIEETIAALAGYEGSLPKGTSILDTEMGKQILNNQDAVDYYFNQSSVPYGGVWDRGPTIPQRLTDLFREFSPKRRK